jgi:CheY-like chemotaxis protein
VRFAERLREFLAGPRQEQDAAPGEELLGLIEANFPNVVLLDIDFPSLSGLELCRKIVRYYPSIRVIMLSPNPNDEQLFEVIKTGAVAYVAELKIDGVSISPSYVDGVLEQGVSARRRGSGR